MKKFEISITQTFKKYVEVEAESLEEAKHQVTENYYRGNELLDENHFLGIEVEGEEKEPERIKVVLLEPGKIARATEIDASLEGMQSIVGGLIEPGYYFEEPVCIIVNEEGKMLGLDLNRGVYDENKKLIDIIVGTAFICGCSGENFESLSDEQIKKYLKQFKYPEKFFRVNDQIKGIQFNPKSKDFVR